MTDNRPSTKGAGTATVFGVVDVAGRNYGWFLTEDRARNAAIDILRDKLLDALFVNWVDGRGTTSFSSANSAIPFSNRSRTNIAGNSASGRWPGAGPIWFVEWSPLLPPWCLRSGSATRC
jgi:hypothetical protein